MSLFKKKVKVTHGTGEKIYQYKDGTFLPDSLQPSPAVPTEYTAHNSVRYINVTIASNGLAMMKVKGEMCETDKSLPDIYINRENCCGCTACYSICPMSGPNRPELAITGQSLSILTSGHDGHNETKVLTGAITMLPDEEGFLYPVVDASICIRCYKCLDVCAFKEAQRDKGYLKY